MWITKRLPLSVNMFRLSCNLPRNRAKRVLKVIKRNLPRIAAVLVLKVIQTPPTPIPRQMTGKTYN